MLQNLCKKLPLNKQPYNRRWLRDNKPTIMWIRRVVCECMCFCCVRFVVCLVHSVFRIKYTLNGHRKTASELESERWSPWLSSQYVFFFFRRQPIYYWLCVVSLMLPQRNSTLPFAQFVVLLWIFLLVRRSMWESTAQHSDNVTQRAWDSYCAFDVKNNLAHCFAIEPLLLLNAWLSGTFVPPLPRKWIS